MDHTVKPENILDVKTIIPEIEINLAYAGPDNFTGQIVPGYFKNIAYLSCEAALKLKAAHDELNSFGLNFKVFDAYRPVQAVLFFYDIWRLQEEASELKQRFYPHLNKNDLFNKGYIATQSSHSRASTVDLTLIDSNSKKELDMGCEFDFFSEKSHTYFNRLTPEQKRNRLLLKSLLEKYGFINYHKEWWHYKLEHEPYHHGFDFPVL